MRTLDDQQTMGECGIAKQDIDKKLYSKTLFNQSQDFNKEQGGNVFLNTSDNSTLLIRSPSKNSFLENKTDPNLINW
jgi:hypothetical protein